VRPVTLDDFRKCAITGCTKRVYIPFGPARCGTHGGPGDTDLDYDAFGEPASAAAAGSSPGRSPAP
jgi:hypothetical protein